MKIKIKKYILNKITIALTIMLTLISICFISTKTYAYTINENGDLVGDNLFDINNPSSSTNVTYTINDNYQNIVLGNNQQYGRIVYSYELEPYTTYTISFKYIQTEQTGFFVVGVNNNDINNPLQNINGTINLTFTTQASGDTSLRFYTNTSQNVQNELTLSYIMLNEGNTAQEWEPYGVWYSEFNYDTLKDNYNELYNYNKYGWLKYIDNLDLTIGGTFIQEFNFNQLVTNNYISNNKINVYDLSRLSNPNYTYSSIDIYFNDSIKNLDTFNYNLFSLSSNGDYASSIVSIYDSEDHVATFEFSNEIVVITPQDIINKNKLFNGNIYNINIYNSSPDSAINYYTDSNYGNGYQSGYNYGRTIADSIERELNNTIKEKDNQIEQLQIEKQQAYNNGYTNGYNEGNTNSNGLYNMVIAVADTPISIFKQIFNFNILGLDISGFIFGIISLLIIVWLIKKII